jgi:hypothetical protein
VWWLFVIFLCQLSGRVHIRVQRFLQVEFQVLVAIKRSLRRSTRDNLSKQAKENFLLLKVCDKSFVIL